MAELKLLEEDVQRTVTDALRLHGWRWVHFRPAQARDGRWLTPYEGDDGFPDIVALKTGTLLALECKGTRGSKKPGPNVKGSELKRLIRWEQQVAWLDAFADVGDNVTAIFVTPDTLDEVLEVIAS